jgi:hypothetical protein
MARLVIFIPFPREGQNRMGSKSDLQRIVHNLENPLNPGTAVPLDTKVGDISISELIVVYAGEEAAQVRAGDVLLVNAHGGDGNYYDLTDNNGNTDSADGVLNRLVTLGAANAVEAIFYCCFSSKPKHIARLYKTTYSSQAVYGSSVACAGAEFFKVRGGRPKSGLAMRIVEAVWINHDGLQRCD